MQYVYNVHTVSVRMEIWVFAHNTYEWQSREYNS